MSKQHYISVEQFNDFKLNQDKLINVLNHNMTSLTKTVSGIAVDVASMTGSFKVTSKVVWGIASIIFLIVGAACLSVIKGG